jgi:Xaa-Pro aminopeptidase
MIRFTWLQVLANNCPWDSFALRCVTAQLDGGSAALDPCSWPSFEDQPYNIYIQLYFTKGTARFIHKNKRFSTSLYYILNKHRIGPLMLAVMTRGRKASTQLTLLNSRWYTAALLVSFSARFSVQSFSSAATPSIFRSAVHRSDRLSGSSVSLIPVRGGSSIFSTLRKQTTFLQSATQEEQVVRTENTSMSASSKLDSLRASMKELGLDAWIVPSDDPHLSEYVPEAYMRRAFLTGFKGSAGTAVVTQSEALLWTDSRYWNEAGMQLDSSCWTLQKQGLPDTPAISKWLATQAAKYYQSEQKAFKVGVDPFCHPASFLKEMTDAFVDAARDELDNEAVKVGTLETTNGNLIDPIWGDARPAVPTSPFRVHPLEYAGTSLADKISAIRKEMSKKKATMAVFPSLDDVVYLLNLRCKGDVECNPVGISYVTVTLDSVNLYCDSKKVEASAVQEHLSEVTIKPYDSILQDIVEHAQASEMNKVWMEKARSNLALATVVPIKQLIDSQNAVVPMKARKNEAELEGMRKAHIIDGAAMARFMAWFEETVQERSVSEVEVDLVLTGERAKDPDFVEVSFPTIAGVGPNGAIIHYRAAENEIMRYLDKENPILIDSGGQYTYGTTDVTRTWHFGSPKPEFVDAYTRVLKGNIGMDELVYPEDTPGFVLDVYARRWLWDAGLDYGHGTGHGVGAALNVHEGPMSISPRWNNKEGLKQGMVLSNEPGFYDDGNFGVRIENLLEIQYVDALNKSDDKKKKFLMFKKLTMIPIQKNLIDLSIMTTRELDWLDTYHQEVFDKVSPLLEPDSKALTWLKRSCEKIDRSNM